MRCVTSSLLLAFKMHELSPFRILFENFPFHFYFQFVFFFFFFWSFINSVWFQWLLFALESFLYSFVRFISICNFGVCAILFHSPFICYFYHHLHTFIRCSRSLLLYLFDWQLQCVVWWDSVLIAAAPI